MSILLEVQGIKELQAALKKLPDAVADTGTDEANKYFVNILRAYPPKRHVTYREAYGGWKSDKQRRYVMGAIRRGEIKIPRARTQTLSKGWDIAGSGRRSFIFNETPYADLVMGGGQVRMMTLIGWRKVDDLLEDRKETIVVKFNVGVKKAIRKLGLQGS